MPRRPWSLCCPPCDEDQDSPPQASRRRDGGEGRLLLGVGSQASSSKTRGRVASRSGGSAFYCLRDSGLMSGVLQLLWDCRRKTPK